MSVLRSASLPNFLLFLWVIFVGYLAYTLLSSTDFRPDIRMLWELQEIANDESLKASLPNYVDQESYLRHLVKAQHDPYVNLVNRTFVHEVLSDTTLSDLDKCRMIIREDLNKVIKLNYGKFKRDSGDKSRFEIQLRDICTGDFKLEVKYSAQGQKEINKLLLFESHEDSKP